MKWLSIALIALLFCSISLQADVSYDLDMEVVQNAAVAGGEFDLKVRIRASEDLFKLGSSNLVFIYNTAALSDPLLLQSHGYSGGIYDIMSVTEPASGRVSLNIALFAPNLGAAVPASFQDVVTIRFTILDPAELTGMIWRTDAPNQSVVYADDETTLVPPGELNGLDVTLPAGEEPDPSRITAYELLPNYPNPFNPNTRIEYRLPEATDVKLTIYNLLGQPVKTLIAGRQPAGHHALNWDATNEAGQVVGSGIYIYRMESQAASFSRKMILLR